jgi:DNA-directed RNA polymerase specialized sigma24 family protein
VTYEQFAATRLTSLLRSAVLLTGDRDLARDVVQRVLARAHVKWKKISRSESPEVYVRRMVLLEYLSWRRSWATRNRRVVGTADDIWGRLATLGRKERAVVVLRYYEQYDDDGIALLMGCSTATVRSHAAKALTTLQLTSEPNPIPVSPIPVREIR